jgi:formylglycine-generating enzyme required for sulfatase activity
MIKRASLQISLCVVILLSISGMVSGACPRTDVNGDCKVDLADFAIMASEWLTESHPDPNGMVLVDIPAGTFDMGDSFSEWHSDELPVHTVTLSSFKMSKYEITNVQYAEFLNSAYPAQIKVVGGVVYAASDTSNSYPYFDTRIAYSYSQIDFSVDVFTVLFKDGRDMSDDPVVCVSWYGANAFCDFYGYVMPTEAQWEYAARGGLSGKRFPWGDTITHSHANYKSDTSREFDTSPTRGYHPTWDDGIEPYTSPVGSFAANGYGLHDMAGNAFEWCADWFDSSYYSITPSTDPTGPTIGDYRVFRGGTWYHNANYCRVANRFHNDPSNRYFYRGFRVCRVDNEV